MRGKNQSSEGSALLVAVMVAFILSLLVASTLKLVTNEFRFTKFSTVWAQALQTAESGVELAMDAYNSDLKYGTGWSGWSYNGSDTYSKTYSSLSPTGHGGLASEYTITVNTNTLLVTATGRLNEPASTNTLERTVRVRVEYDIFWPFAKGMLGKNNIKIQGNPYCDSFNSELGAYGGANINDACSIGSMSSSPGGITGGGSADVQGDVYVTDTGDAEGGFWSGNEYSSLDVDIPDVVPPFTAMTDPAIGGGDVITVAGSKDMGVPSIDGSGGSKEVIIQGYGKLRIYSAGNIDFGTPEELTLSPDPGKTLSVEIYCNGSEFDMKGTLNNSGTAADLTIYGTPNCTSFGCTANNDKNLTIYAPQADIKLGGNAQIFGAVVGNNITCLGTFDFHYDESLATNKSPMVTGVDVKNWKEL